MIFRTRILLKLCLISPLPWLLEASPSALEEARSATREWIHAEKVISLEAIEWKEQKTLWQDLIAVSAKRIEEIEKQLDEGEAAASAVKREQRELMAAEADLQLPLKEIRSFLENAESTMRAMQTRLPEPLQTELQTLYQQIADASKQTSPSVSERMRTLTQMLTQIREFDGRISVGESVRTLSGSGEEGIFRTLWIGLGQAYYVSFNDAGYGVPDEDGWTWHSQPHLANRIHEAIALAEERTTAPKWIHLPVHLPEGASR